MRANGCDQIRIWGKLAQGFKCAADDTLNDAAPPGVGRSDRTAPPICQEHGHAVRAAHGARKVWSATRQCVSLQLDDLVLCFVAAEHVRCSAMYL